MYFKTIRKYCKAENTTHTYFRLCESYRDANGFPRQRMVLGLGRLLELHDIDQKILFLERLNDLIKGEPRLFNLCKDELVERLAQHYYRELKTKKKIDRVSGIPTDFGFYDKGDELNYFNAKEDQYALKARTEKGKSLSLDIMNWDSNQHIWYQSSTSGMTKVVYTINNLKPDLQYIYFDRWKTG